VEGPLAVGAVREGLLAPGSTVPAEIEHGAVLLDAGKGQHGQVQIFFLRELVQGCLDVPCLQMQVVHGGHDHLRDGQLAAVDLKDLHVALDKLRGAGIHLGGGGGEHFRGEILHIQVRNGGQDVGGGPVLFRGGGGVEVQRVRENGAQHEPCKLNGDGNLVLPEDGCHNGAGGAHDLIPELDRVLRREVVDPVVVDDLQHLGLFNGPDRLGELVVVHQNQFLAGSLHDVVPGYIARQVPVGIRNGVDVVAALQHFPADVLGQLRVCELHQLPLHDLTGRGGEVDVTGGVHGPVSGDHNGAVVQLGRFDHICLDGVCPDDNQQPRALADDLLLGLRVAAADNDAVLHIVVLQSGALGHGNDADLAVEHHGGVVIDDLAVQGLADVFQGRLGHDGDGAGGVVQTDDGDIGLGHHADELFLLVHHAAVGPVALLHLLQAFENGGFRADVGRRIHGYLPYGDPGIGEQLGLLEVEPIQQIPGLLIQLSQAAGHRRSAERALEKRVSNGRSHRVRIRMLVAGNINGGFLHG